MDAQLLTDRLILEIAGGEIEDGSEVSIGQTFEAASGLDSLAITTALEYLAGFGRTRPRALAGLIDRGDESAFRALVRHLHSYGQLDLIIFSSVIDASFRSSSPAIIDSLASLAFDANTPDVIRGAAAQPLRSVHTKEALPYVAEMLESADPEMRQRAVFGFSEFANGLPMTTPEGVVSGRALAPDEHSPYKTADTMRYFALPIGLSYAEQEPAVKFWREWWASHKAELRLNQ